MLTTMDWLFRQPRSVKRIISLALDATFITLAYWGAYILRLEESSLLTSPKHWIMLAVILPLTLVCFIRLGLYRAVLRFLSHQVISTVLISIGISVAVMVISAHYLHALLPRSVPVFYAAFVLIFCGGARILVRALYNQGTKRQKIPVIIYGAGSSGRQLNTSLLHGIEYRAVAFVDDNPTQHKSILQGVTVYSPEQLPWLIHRFGVQKLLLAVPSLSRQRRRDILESLESLPLEILTIPGMADIVSGMAKVSELQEVSIDDLLGRDSVDPYPELIAANIRGKVVMVTGSGGSIGSELCRQILQQCPKVLVLFEMSEFALYKIDQELTELSNASGLSVKIIPLMGSVQQQKRLEGAMNAYGVQTVYHAAACKHVPLVEYNVVEGVSNNIFGTWRTAEASINTGVETFVLISTDKAVRPTNVMGATKRLAELVLQGLAQRQTSTRFCMVRFGNVLGSSGSVVPLFKNQIRSGGPITLTHEDITRYFMTIPEAAQLVIQAGALGKGGDVFVLDMGEPIRIIDLARKMIRLMGSDVKDEENPDGDIAIQIIGLRPGEKLYEELLIGEDEQPTLHPRIRTAQEVSLPWEEMVEYLSLLNGACEAYDQEGIRELLLKAPAGFSPQDGICDLVWTENKSASALF